MVQNIVFGVLILEMHCSKSKAVIYTLQLGQIAITLLKEVFATSNINSN